MGTSYSQITSEELQKYQRQHGWTLSEQELQTVFRAFIALDDDENGMLSRNEILNHCHSLRENPLVDRVLRIFDSDNNAEVDFSEFVKHLQIFCDLGNSEQKLDFAFKVYDTNNDGFISNGDLFNILKIMVGENLNDIQIQQLVDRTILQADKDKDGKLNFEEFKNFVIKNDITVSQGLTISIN